MENKTLQHHGIKGQKWGIRRFQNKDGSLTPAGKKRQSDSEGDSKPKKRKLKDLSDAELREKINRMELEKRYKDLKDTKTPGKVKRFFESVMEDSAKQIITKATVNIGAQTLAYAMGVGVNAVSDKAFKTGSIIDPKNIQKKKK